MEVSRVANRVGGSSIGNGEEKEHSDRRQTACPTGLLGADGGDYRKMMVAAINTRSTAPILGMNFSYRDSLGWNCS